MQSLGSCFKYTFLYSKLSWKWYNLHVFRAVEGQRKFFIRNVWGLCTPESSILRTPNHCLVFFIYIWSHISGNFSVRNENKTLEIDRFGRHQAMVTSTFPVQNLETKNCLSRTPKVFQSMLSKSILINFIVLNGQIKPKGFYGFFFPVARDGKGNWRGFHTGC